MSSGTNASARRIAARGREALIERLRPAFERAAREHSDVLELDEAGLERVIQDAADRADGLQWRRVLASVASEELGISLGEALEHPAVERAQKLAGAPSYEADLARLGSPGAPGAAAPSAVPEPREPALAAPEDLSTAEAAPDVLQTAPEQRPPLDLDLPVVHVRGLGNLEPNERDVTLHFWEQGLDIIRADEIIGHLSWPEIRALSPSEPHRRRRRGAQLTVLTDHGEATFLVPDTPLASLREQLAPVREYI